MRPWLNYGCGVILAAAAGWGTTTALAGEAVPLDFQGLTQADAGTRDTVPPDVTGDVGPSGIAEFVSGAFATYDKQTGNRTDLVSDATFWTRAGISASTITAGTSAPRLLYDPGLGRWLATEVTNDKTGDKIVLGISTTASPSPAAGNWHAVTIAATAAGTASASTYGYADYPTLGFDANGVYLGTDNYASKNGPADNSGSLFSIPKADLAAPAGPSLAHLTAVYGVSEDNATRGFILQPTVNVAPTATREVTFAEDYNQFGLLDRTDIIGSAGPGASLITQAPVTVQDANFAASPRQPAGGNTAIDPFDDRFAGTIYRVGNLAYMAHAIGIITVKNGVPSNSSMIRWIIARIDGDSATTIIQEGTIQDPAYDYFQPSIAADAAGDIVISCNRSGVSLTDGMLNAYHFIGRPDASGNVVLGSPQQDSFSTVTDFHTPDKDPAIWTRHGALVPDPSNPQAFWSFQEVPASSITWGTQVTEILLPEPTGLVAGVGALVLLRRPKRGR